MNNINRSEQAVPNFDILGRAATADVRRYAYIPAMKSKCDEM